MTPSTIRLASYSICLHVLSILRKESFFTVVVAAVLAQNSVSTSTYLSVSRFFLVELLGIPISKGNNMNPYCFHVLRQVQLLRTMLQWEEQVHRGTSLAERSLGVSTCTKPILHEVAIIFWPNGKIMRMSTGSTAADAARRMGVEGKLLWVNGQLVLPQTELKDGDIVEVRL